MTTASAQQHGLPHTAENPPHCRRGRAVGCFYCLPFEPQPACAKGTFSPTSLHTLLINAPLSCFQPQGPFFRGEAVTGDLTPLRNLALQQRLLTGLFLQVGVLHITPTPAVLSLTCGAWVSLGPTNCSVSEHSLLLLPLQVHRSIKVSNWGCKCESSQHGYDHNVTQPRNSQNTRHLHTTPALQQQTYFCAGTDSTHRALHRGAGSVWTPGTTPAAGQPGAEGEQGDCGACSRVKWSCNCSRTWISEGVLRCPLTLLAQLQISVLTDTEYGIAYGHLLR